MDIAARIRCEIMKIRFLAALALCLPLLLVCAACEEKQNISVDGDPQESGLSYPARSMIRIDGKTGFLDASGNLVIEPRFDEAVDFREGLAPVKVDGWWGIIDIDGNWVAEPRFYGVDPDGYRRGFLAVRSGDGAWMFVDRQGRVIATRSFRNPPRFDERGLSWQEGPYYRLLNSRGELVEYELIRDLSESVLGDAVALRLADGSLYIAVYPEPHDDFYFHDRQLGLHSFKSRAGSFGLLDEQGNWAVKPGYLTLRPFKQGLAAAQSFESPWFWGFINPAGEWVVPPQFEALYDLEESGLARASLGPESWGLVDQAGNWALEPALTRLGEFHGGLAAMRVNGKYGFVDMRGQVAIEPRFDLVDLEQPFAGHDLAVAALGQGRSLRYGIIDRSGNWVTRPEYSHIKGYPAEGGCTSGQDEQGRIVIFNAAGQPVAQLATEKGREALRGLEGKTLWPKPQTRAGK